MTTTVLNEIGFTLPHLLSSACFTVVITEYESQGQNLRNPPNVASSPVSSRVRIPLRPPARALGFSLMLLCPRPSFRRHSYIRFALRTEVANLHSPANQCGLDVCQAVPLVVHSLGISEVVQRTIRHCKIAIIHSMPDNHRRPSCRSTPRTIWDCF